MAVDFYYLNDQGRKNCLFQLNDTDFETMENTLAEYKRRTGLGIDQYGRTYIYVSNIKLIAELLEISFNASADKKLLEIKEKFKKADADLIAIGD